MGMGGVYREIIAPERIVCTERFDDFWYAGEAIARQFSWSQYETAETRDAVTKSPMASGFGESYTNLAVLLRTLR